MEDFVNWLRKTTETFVGNELATLLTQILREAIALLVIEFIAVISFRLSQLITSLLGVGENELHHFIVFAHEALIVLGLIALVSRGIFHYFNYIRGEQ